MSPDRGVPVVTGMVKCVLGLYDRVLVVSRLQEEARGCPVPVTGTSNHLSSRFNVPEVNPPGELMVLWRISGAAEEAHSKDSKYYKREIGGGSRIKWERRVAAPGSKKEAPSSRAVVLCSPWITHALQSRFILNGCRDCEGLMLEWEKSVREKE